MGEQGIEAAVIAEFLRRERQRQPEVQIPLELPLPLVPYWPEQGTEKEKDDDEGCGITIIPLYDDDEHKEEDGHGVTVIKIYDDNDDEEEQDMIRVPL